MVIDDATIRTTLGDSAEVIGTELAGDNLTMQTAEGVVAVMGRAR